MSLDLRQVEELKGYYSDLKLVEDGGVEFIFISPFPLPAGCSPTLVDALLCPSKRDGYPSRLFVSAKIEHKGPGQNWNPQTAAIIAGRQWWAVSWKTADNQTLLGMVLAHLEAFK
jgi:hypothetical protein